MIWKNVLTKDQVDEITKNTMVSNLGISFTKIGDNFISATMPVDERTIQPAGILHGGASVALAETLGSVASIACSDREKEDIVGIEINANHLRSVRSGKVTGTVRPLKIGRKLHVWDIAIEDEEGSLVCTSRLTVMVIPRK
jgi:1,4-dihydroxy-2-naphthoyl-CoA hydrolase